MISTPLPAENLMRWPSFPWLFWAFSSSLALHSVAYASLSLSPRRPAVSSLPSEVTFEVSEPAPKAPPPEDEPEREDEKPIAESMRPEPIRVAKAAPAVAARLPASESRAAAAPLDLSGVTLTNDQGSGFGIETGNGRAFEGPIGNGRGPANHEVVEPAPRPAVPASSLVAASDLSSRPAAPALGDALRQNYPREAKERLVGGSARVLARIEPDGSVRQIRIENESFSGFGEACRKTLRGSRWSAPRDRDGRAVATEIRYTCRFVVQP